MTYPALAAQMLLRAGVQQSRRTPTRQHPYGFHREKYVYALMSAVGMFCVGAGAAVLHGVWSLMNPPALDHMGWSLAGERGGWDEDLPVHSAAQVPQDETSLPFCHARALHLLA